MNKYYYQLLWFYVCAAAFRLGRKEVRFENCYQICQTVFTYK